MTICKATEVLHFNHLISTTCLSIMSPEPVSFSPTLSLEKVQTQAIYVEGLSHETMSGPTSSLLGLGTTNFLKLSALSVNQTP